MYTKILLVQEILGNGNAKFSLINSDYFQWTFENRRAKLKDDADFFPFEVKGENLSIQDRKPGAETRIIRDNNSLVFTDDYCVPGGFTIGILFPKNYIPTSFKFKDKPVIPVNMHGQIVTNASGHFEIGYNHFEKRCAIIFNIHTNTCFGFKCKATKVKDENFPKYQSVNNNDIFEVTIDVELLKLDSIQTEDLLIINEILQSTDLKELNDTVNEILFFLKENNTHKAKSSFSKLGKLVLNGVSFAGNITKIVESYKKGSASQQFVGKLLEHISW